MTHMIKKFFNISFKGIKSLQFQMQNTSLYLQLSQLGPVQLSSTRGKKNSHFTFYLLQSTNVQEQKSTFILFFRCTVSRKITELVKTPVSPTPSSPTPLDPNSGFRQCFLDPTQNNPEHFFEALFSSHMYTIMAEETNKYAQRKLQRGKFFHNIYFYKDPEILIH